MTYTAPLQDMRFVLRKLCDLDAISQLPGLEEATPDMVDAILEEAAKYAGLELSPLSRSGDLAGLGFEDRRVTMPEGWKTVYDMLVEMGWNSPSASPEYGGMGLPFVVNACIQEMFHGANMAFQLCPMLTQGAIEALECYASDTLKETYLPKLVSGEWTGTMNLTEPQAGSDLAAIRSKAVPEGSRPTRRHRSSPSRPSTAASENTLEMLWIENGVSASPAPSSVPSARQTATPTCAGSILASSGI